MKKLAHSGDAPRVRLKKLIARISGSDPSVEARAVRLVQRFRAIQQKSTLANEKLDQAKRDPEKAEEIVEELDRLIPSLSYDLAQINRALPIVEADVRATQRRMDRRLTRVAQGSLIIEILTVAVGLLWPVSSKFAHGIFLDYYTAVATITPILVVAGLVELATLGHKAAVWVVLSFVFPAVMAGGAALHVLATHKSSPAAYFLSTWGLIATTFALTSYALQHKMNADD